MSALGVRGFLAIFLVFAFSWICLSFGEAIAQLPDLTVSLVSPKTACQGEDITKKVKISVKNQGGIEARDFYVDIILKEPTGAEHRCGRDQINSVTPKHSISSVFSIKHPILIPSDIPTGKYQLCAIVDPTNAVRESRKKNNKSCQNIIITSR